MPIYPQVQSWHTPDGQTRDGLQKGKGPGLGGKTAENETSGAAGGTSAFASNFGLVCTALCYFSSHRAAEEVHREPCAEDCCCHSCAVELQLDEEAQQQSSGAAASDQADSHRRRCDPQVACPGRSHAHLQARTVAWLFVAGLSSCAVVVSFLGQWYHHLFGQSDVGLLCWHLIRSEDMGFVFIILCGWLCTTQSRWTSCCSLRWPGRIHCGYCRAESTHEAAYAEDGPPEDDAVATGPLLRCLNFHQSFLLLQPRLFLLRLPVLHVH